MHDQVDIITIDYIPDYLGTAYGLVRCSKTKGGIYIVHNHETQWLMHLRLHM